MMMFEGIPIAIIIDRITNCQISLFRFINQIKNWRQLDVGDDFLIS